jgi:CheY-like chemotaxis protein
LLEEITSVLLAGNSAAFPHTLTATLSTPEEGTPVVPFAKGGDDHPDVPESLKKAAVDRQEQEAAAARPGTIRLLLVDDHMAVRQAFAFALKSEVGIEVVGEAGTGPAALEEIRRLRPDLVLMDINLPGMSGIEATRKIRAEYPQIDVIGLSMYESEEQDAAMRRAGARAYVSKSASYDTLLAAIRASRTSDHP